MVAGHTPGFAKKHALVCPHSRLKSFKHMATRKDNIRMSMSWKGVMPAQTTAFDKKGSIDHKFVARHAVWMVDAGCTGIIAPGSLGEGNTLTFAEKGALWRTLVGAVGKRVPVVAAIAALSTDEAVSLAKEAADAGCQGLMVLPPYVYKGDWPEMKAHVATVMRATKLSCMLYNNPIAYGTDFKPEHIAELAREVKNFHSVKESSADVRRIMAIKELVGSRLTMCMGVDDAIVEGMSVGVEGWVAGLVNALPKESVDLYNFVRNGEMQKALRLYNWFLPLLRLDTVGKFVQLIKLCQQEVGMGNERVRAPRLALAGTERNQALAIIRHALANKPKL
jgi:4-hydroxy-tetrahydrodipicolinate synthase